MRKLVIMIVLLSAVGCSTLHIHKGFYLNAEQTDARASSACPNGVGDYGEPVLLKIDDQELQLLPWYKNGFAMIGPVFVPFIPIFWVSTKTDSIGINVIPAEKSTAISLDLSRWHLILDDGTKILPKASHYETLDSGVTIKNIGGGVWLVFEFSERAVPDSFTLVAPKSFKQGQETQKVAFVRINRWHYDPFVFMHSEWPYTHRLPCKRE